MRDAKLRHREPARPEQQENHGCEDEPERLVGRHGRTIWGVSSARAMVQSQAVACAMLMPGGTAHEADRLFYFFFGSVYANLSVMRIGMLADKAGLSVRWRPFNVRTVMKENNVALRTEALKVPYMWRDIERRAATHGLAFVPPPVCRPTPSFCTIWWLARRARWLGRGLHRCELQGLDRGPHAARRSPQRWRMCWSLWANTRQRPSRRRRARRWRSTMRTRRRPPAAGIFGSPSFVVDAKCSGATTGWKRRLPGPRGTTGCRPPPCSRFVSTRQPCAPNSPWKDRQLPSSLRRKFHCRRLPPWAATARTIA